LLKNGRLIVSFFTVTPTPNSELVYVIIGSISINATITWGTPIAVTSLFNLWTATTSKVIELANGTLLLPIYGQNIGDILMSSAVMKSTDGGVTWGSFQIIATCTSTDRYDEACGVLLKSGKIVMLIRHDVSTTGQHYSRVYSNDNGVSWLGLTDVMDITFAGRPVIVELGLGGLLFVGRGSGYGKTCWATSWDEGATWSAFKMLDNYVSTYASMVRLSDKEIGCVWSKELGDLKNTIHYCNFIEK
jgi:hypothetical protein